MGALCDAIGPKRVMLIAHGGCALGLVLVMVLPQTDMAMIGALLIYALSLPLTTMMFPLISMDLFGYQAQSQYIGVIMSMGSACGIISGPLANLVRDTLGTYRPVFWGCAILAVCMLGLYGILYAMVAKDRKKLEAEANV
jgi:MFS family permease